MHTHKHAFFEFCIRQGVLKFGDFVLKSGRKSPYFFNTGLISSGAALAALGGFYASAIAESGLRFDVLFGPAYKGIPLAAAAAIALAQQHGHDAPYAFNRKEAKTHGEGGEIVGAALRGGVLIVDDVITAGTAVNESLELIRRHGARPAGVVISLDRQEKGQGSRSAIQEIEAANDIKVISIATLSDLLDYIGGSKQLQAYADSVQRYREEYGI
ncbi:MAG TPA: orotate phosphoribosyltransferase [Gammaproteobacteria bacterium]|nr:orotate phosphoribosyltransferase [Gammaproteobacteria bacterium]